MDPRSTLQGQEVGRDEAPVLWRTLDDLAARLGMPKLERVVLIAEPGAAAIEHQHPRRPWRRHRTLALGLPLLAGLSAAQMQAVVAHEMVHFSRHFGWFGYWWCWARQAVAGLFRRRQAGRLAGGAHWFGPLLAGPLAQAAARAEFEADAWAADATSAAALGEALLRLAVASARPTPTFGEGPLPEAPWRRAAPGLGAAVGAAELAQALRADAERHARQTDVQRAHPSAHARLQALQWPIPRSLAAVPPEQAAGPCWWGEAAWAERLRIERRRWRAENARAWHTEACWREACASELPARPDDLATAWECEHALGLSMKPPPEDGQVPDQAAPLHAYWRGVAWQAHDAAEATLWLQAAARRCAGLEAPASLRLLEPMPGRAPLSSQVRESLADARQRRNEARTRTDTQEWLDAEPVDAAGWRAAALRQALSADGGVVEALWLQQPVDAPGDRRYCIVTLWLRLASDAPADPAVWMQAYSPLLARVITPAGVGQLHIQPADAPWPEPIGRLLSAPLLRLK